MPQRDLISSSQAVDPGSRQIHTVASQAYGKGDRLERGIKNHLYTAGGDIRGDYFLQEVSARKNLGSSYGNSDRSLVISVLHRMHACVYHETCTDTVADTFNLDLMHMYCNYSALAIMHNAWKSAPAGYSCNHKLESLQSYIPC